jgi:hypothetical protein
MSPGTMPPDGAPDRAATLLDGWISSVDATSQAPAGSSNTSCAT